MSRRNPDRREFLRQAGLGLAAMALPPSAGALGAAAGRPKIAAVVTEFTYRSHAHVILENFLGPYLFNGEKTEPGVEVVSLYVDQFPEGDMAREVAREFGIPIYPTIGEAVRNGGKTLGVDGVLSIGEHGKYPVNAKGQVEYPRKRFFDEIVATFEASGRAVPVFNDKHLSYRWDLARAMYDESRRLAFPFMAGSSVPLAQRRPSLELPPGAPIRSAVSIHGGNIEGYDFHGLEVLQSMVESRRGGETGRRRGAIPHRRRALEGGRRRALVDGAGRRRHGRRARPRPADPARAAGGETPARSDSRHPRDLRRRPAGGRPEGRPVLHPMELRLPDRGGALAEGHELLHRPLGQSQPLQGPLPRDPVDVPDRPRPLSGRAHAADHRHPGRGDGFAPRRAARSRRRTCGSPTSPSITARCARWGRRGRSSPSGSRSRRGSTRRASRPPPEARRLAARRSSALAVLPRFRYSRSVSRGMRGRPW